MSIKELLIRSKEKIKDPRHWVRGSLVGIRDGEECFCARGALYDTACGGRLTKIFDSGAATEFNELVSRPDVREAEEHLNVCALKVKPDMPQRDSITNLNDIHGTHEDVLAAFDCAIEKA